MLVSFLGVAPDGGGGSAHVISRFSAFYSRLFIFIHIFSFSLLTIVNIRDNMCTNKNERRCFYVY